MSKQKQNAAVLPMFCPLVAMALLCVAAPDAAASNKKGVSRDIEAMRQAQLQLNEARQQKAVLEQEKAALSGEVSALKMKAARLGSAVSKANDSLSTLDKEAEMLRGEKAELSGKLQEAAGKLQEATRRYSEAAQALQKEQAEKDMERRRFEAVTSRKLEYVRVCEEKNTRLYQISVEMMEKYRSRSMLDRFLEAEPFTGLKSVETENLLEEYRDKADASKIAPPSGMAAR